MAQQEGKVNSKSYKIRKELENEKLQKGPEDLKLLYFLGVQESEWYGKQRSLELEK